MCFWKHIRVSQIGLAGAVFGHLLIVVISIFLTQEAVAASPGDSSFSPQVARWEIQEISLKSTRSYANAFKDVNLTCR